MQIRTAMAAVWALAALAAPVAAQPPLIASTSVSGDQTTLTIRGVYMMPVSAGSDDCGTLSAPVPEVVLQATALTVTASCRTQVTAMLPPKTCRRGTYLLMLERSDEEIAVFYPTFGAVGPQGACGSSRPARPGGPARPDRAAWSPQACRDRHSRPPMLWTTPSSAPALWAASPPGGRTPPSDREPCSQAPPPATNVAVGINALHVTQLRVPRTRPSATTASAGARGRLTLPLASSEIPSFYHVDR